MSQPTTSAETAPVVENPGQEVPPGESTENNQTPEGTDNLTPEQLRAELSKVRKEAADRRIKLRDAEEKAKKWSEYEESQKTELQKLQEAVAERDKKLAEKETDVLRAKIARKHNVSDEDLDLLVGDEANMERLAVRLGKSQEPGKNAPTDLLGGPRGTPVGSKGTTFSMDDFIRGTARR
jgi:23S rRNA pseudoU1915 N3-methylase RlmH